jgi:hypothetical protein
MNKGGCLQLDWTLIDTPFSLLLKSENENSLSLPNVGDQRSSIDCELLKCHRSLTRCLLLTSVCMLRRFIPTATRFIHFQQTPLSRQFVTSSSLLTRLNNLPKPTPNKMSAPEQGGSAVNLHPDPVTGEMISKSELKKREKQRAKDAARAEKKAAAPAPVAGEKKEKSEKDNEEELDAGVSAQELCLCNRSFRIFSHSQFVAILCSAMQEDPGIARVQVSRPVPSQVPRHPVCS